MTHGKFGFNPDYSDDAPTFAEVSQMSGRVLLEFGTDWCGHCRAAQQALQQAMAGDTTLVHVKVTDGKGKPLGRAFHVKLWPTLILLRDGTEIGRLVRPVDAEEVRQLLAHLDT